MMPPADISLVGADLREADLRNTDLSNKVLFLTDLRGAKLYGAKVALECQQFHKVRLDNTQVATLLLMIALADIEPKYKQGLQQLVQSVVGDQYEALQRMLRLV
jgi:hypothetical protein